MDVQEAIAESITKYEEGDYTASLAAGTIARNLLDMQNPRVLQSMARAQSREARQRGSDDG